HQRAAIEAAMARIIPTDDQPGAREAGTVEFLDRYLSGIGFIYAKPDGSGFETLDGRRAAAWQHRIEVLRAKYVAGVLDLDRRSRARFGADFAALAPEQQDQVLADMERAEQEPATTLSPAFAIGGPTTSAPALQQTSTEVELDFFPLLVAHTRQGFYADPIYGGNKDRLGWQVIGFPGPASLMEVFTGRYSTLAWFAEGQENGDGG
ncbi:MAG: gluconate 2-dehydrogenase subunit 3 family protein, partial [Pseudomonadota bacterium]|nr:gluconate 2-dehydrogenase subunit 3 family protein [Pseudomonadota bacterium]